MKHALDFDEKCKSCHGTGIYVGTAERDGYAVVCQTCNGTGKHHFHYEYEDFEAREPRSDVKKVLQVNPGIVVGGTMNFGGLTYEEWVSGKKFLAGSEMREFTCPCWWYQSADHSKKPEWGECWKSLGYSLSKCPYFKTKSECWDRWDKENAS